MTTTPPTSGTPPQPNSDAPKLQLDPRDMLVIFLALAAGTVTGLLTYASGTNLAGAVLAGLAGFGAALYAFDRWIR